MQGLALTVRRSSKVLDPSEVLFCEVMRFFSVREVWHWKLVSFDDIALILNALQILLLHQIFIG